MSMNSSNDMNAISSNNTSSNQAGKLDGIVETSRPARTYVKPGELKKGDLIKGQYKDSFTGGKFNTTAHVLSLSNGTEVAINGCRDLDDKFSRIPKGNYVTVKYNGEKEFKTKRGMATSHEFWVEMSSDGSSYTPVKKLSKEERAAAESASSENSFRS